MNKIDYRRHYVLVLDTETANTFMNKKNQLEIHSALVYDCGWRVMDTRGNVYVERYFVNRDVFVNERDLMKSSYYAH